jgi:uncharacterized protein (TIGR02246 family)
VKDESDGDIQTQVETMLRESAAAWNRGDLEAFLDDYSRAATTTYIGGGGIVVGWEGIRDRYAPLFATDAERDSLRFESLRARHLGALYVLVTARWVLYRGDTVTASGPFTLIVRRVSGGWKIIHDHSSSDPAPAEE